MQKETVLELKPAAGNPRNSEGAFLRLADGGILFAYSRYSGEGAEWEDDSPCDIAARYSRDGGATWSGRDRILIPRGDAMNVMSVSLLRISPERIMMLYLRKSHDPQNRVECRPFVTFSEDEGESWETPRALTSVGGYFVVNNDRLLQLEQGRIIIPCAWHRPTENGHDSRAIGLFLLSDDGGRTFREAADWVLPPQSSASGVQEPGVVELAPGKLLAFFRTDQGYQMTSVSDDAGEHWSSVKPSNFISPLSPMTLKRDPFGGQLWAVWNDRSGRWNLPKPEESSWQRTPLTLGIGGKPDPESMELSLLENDPRCGYCYVALHFEPEYVLLACCCGGNGTIVLQPTRIIRLKR